MARMNLKDDIKPLSEFRANAAGFIEQVRKSKRALVLTQRGHSAAVLLDVAKYEALVEELEILRDVRTATMELDSGAGISHEIAKKRLLSGSKR